MIPTGDALARKQTITELVAIFRECERDIIEGFRLIDGAQKKLGSTFGRDQFDIIRVTGRHNTIPYFDDPKPSLEIINREVWSRIVDHLGVRQLMSVDASKELCRQLEKDDLPPISVEAAMLMFKGFFDAAPDMLQQAVNEVFEFLRPYNSKHKSNSEYEVPRRVVKTGIVEPWVTGKIHVRYYYEPYLVALENVLNSIAGNGSICKTHKSELSNALAKADSGETSLFKFRAFKNGNLHLTFKDADLLARFNAKAGGKRLHGDDRRTNRE